MCQPVCRSLGETVRLLPAITLGAVVTFSGDGAIADQTSSCTEARLTEQQSGLKQFVQEHPEHQMAVVNTIAEVENEYGGDVPREKQCEVLDKVLKVLAGGTERPTPIKR